MCYVLGQLEDSNSAQPLDLDFFWTSHEVTNSHLVEKMESPSHTMLELHEMNLPITEMGCDEISDMQLMEAAEEMERSLAHESESQEADLPRHVLEELEKPFVQGTAL